MNIVCVCHHQAGPLYVSLGLDRLVIIELCNRIPIPGAGRRWKEMMASSKHLDLNIDIDVGLCLTVTEVRLFAAKNKNQHQRPPGMLAILFVVRPPGMWADVDSLTCYVSENDDQIK
jgi:hypothetical protein